MSKQPCLRCGAEDGGKAHVCNESAYQMANKKAARMLKTLNKLVEKFGGDDNDVSDWMDSMGCCKICGGEIPGGHHNDCYVYAKECEIKELKAEIQGLEDALGADQ